MQSKRIFPMLLALLCALPVAFAAEKRPTNAIEVPYTKYLLSAALTLIVHLQTDSLPAFFGSPHEDKDRQQEQSSGTR